MNTLRWSLPLVLIAAPTLAADPWADAVVSYAPGSGVPVQFGTGLAFDQPAAALGEPTRQSVGFGGYVVSPFSPAGDPTEVVALGEGGSLVVRFDEPVTDDPLNPFGIDLLVFGNSFFLTNNFDFNSGTTITGVASEGGVVELSADGMAWTTITGLAADGAFPTNGYADTVDFFPATAGGVLADFTQPVDPALDPTGLGAAAIVAAYAGSGGGAGIDLGDYGLSAVRFVRITNPVGSGVTPEIDGFADVRAVPEPTALWLLACALAMAKPRVRV